ncbi:MAG: adenylyltransferase [Syntrophus sp. (in: bacteria)]|nr:adenylyltransferase [Syntrophus sp. (in: bacteria)]
MNITDPEQPLSSLSEDELLRYHRQIIIPQIGEEGQRKIKGAGVFVAGVGGLGSISAYYLAAAGIGRLRIVDRDRVEAGNLNRQIMHWTNDIGAYKVDSASEKLSKLNHYCHIESIQGEMREDNIVELIGDCSIIVDATDNLETRKFLNRASLQKGIPFIYGGVDRFNGMISTFVPGETACFECIFPGAAGEKRPIGIIGPTPGIIASLQALEAVKIILGLEGILKGRLLFFSGTDMTFREIRIDKNPECRICNTVAIKE